jgi:hypothetical protein
MSSSPASLMVKRRLKLVITLAAVVLAGLILLVHGRALSLGLFMDDHAHFRQLRACDWSLAGLVSACRLELVGGVVELWWLPDCTLRFFRPVAFGLMKLTYTLVGWVPGPMHAASLVWHFAVAVLTMLLLRRLGAALWLATVVAGMYAIHMAHVATVQWIACQSELMVTAFLLGATWCFAAFRGWRGFELRDGSRRWAYGFGCWGLFALALGCRENAVMFPLVVLAVEPLVWRRFDRGTAVMYAGLGVLLIAYLGLRAWLLGGMSLPPRPYVMPIGDPDFARYVFDKACYYLLGQFLLVPCVPIGGLPYFQGRPLLFYGLAGAIAVLLVFVGFRYRREPAGALSVAWLVGFMLPVLPVFASPHHLYMPGVGWAIVAMLVLRGLGGFGRAGVRGGRWRRALVGGVVVLSLGVFIRGSTWAGLALRTGHQVEEGLVTELAAAPSGLRDGDTLYVANMPLIGHYARLPLERRTGLRGLRLVPLTWSPRILGVVTPNALRWVDERSLVVTIAEDRYFAGPLGRLVREATGEAVPDRVDCVASLGFTVRVLERDAAGIRSLRFDFERPLNEPDLHLFWGSRARLAAEVEPLAAGETSEEH